MQPSDLSKLREICFNCLPADQADRAFELLDGLGSLEVRRSATVHCILVRYEVTEYTLQGLEDALIAQNFHLDNSLLHKIRRALVYYTEAVQRQNLLAPERHHKTHYPFIRAYDQHPHGDHDDTPVEWREYR
jgi:hypothetical protein